MMMFCIWASTAVEKWWQHEAGSCKGADEQGAASRELSGWLSGQWRSNRDCLGGKKGQGACAMGMCVLEIKDCDALKSVG